MRHVVILPNGEEIQVELPKSGQQPKGSDLLQLVFQNIGFGKADQQYFGLLYCDKEDGRMDWLEKDDNLKSIPKIKSSGFVLAARYYPQHPDLVLKDTNTRRLFCFQIKEKLIRGEWGCDVETHAILDGLLVQANLGDFDPKLHHYGYLKAIKMVDLITPSRLNSDADPSENQYLKRVSYYHRHNIGLTQDEVESLYLKKAKTLALYGFIMHTVVDKNNNEICVGLREQSIALFDSPSFAHDNSLMIKTELYWNSLKFCINMKCKVKLGVEIQRGNMTEFVWKVKNKHCFHGAQRLCIDIKAFQNMYASRDESDFMTKKKEVKRAKSFANPSKTNRTKFQRLNSVATTLRLSLRKKKEYHNEPDLLNSSKTSKQEGEERLENSRVVLVG
ncbi:tyrosine-protein phosphatase non-receptor type 4-like [Rhopilema esculentum]|uniref:tyrosine-protein phosphatase non-receptor type 4-like n=1 Tax=Rhopilema esculentum TaxID=499914 RepID=UPI0031DBEFFC|eukprot:gene12285-2930_t